MMLSYQNTQELLQGATREMMYHKLIVQINKDFQLANLSYEFEEMIAPVDLKIELCEIIFHLINSRFTDYLNLLYIIDVPEGQIKALDGSDLSLLTENVVFLLLRREYQKVCLKKKYSN